MADNVNITPGSGVIVTTEQIGADSSECQLFKLAIATAGSRTKIPADATNGLLVDVSRVTGNVTVVQGTATNLKVDASGVAVPVTDNSGSLTVDAPAGTPVAVRLSTGSAFIDTIPVSGTITVTQGTAALASAPWPVKIGDGTTVASVDSGTQALKVFLAGGTAGGGTSFVDQATFTEGSTALTPVGGEYNDSPSDPTSGKGAAVRITQKRAMHINIRKADGTELGIAATPLRTDPVGTTSQPILLKDASDVAVSKTNPIYTMRTGDGRVRVTKTHALAASQTAVTLATPTSGKRFYITKAIVILSTGGDLTIFDHTNAEANLMVNGTWPIGVFNFNFDDPFKPTANDNLWKYTSGTGTVGVIVLHGYEI